MSVFAPANALDGWEVAIVAAAAVASWLVIHLLVLLDADRRGWHDKAAGTIVTQDFPRVWRRIDDEMNQRWKGYLHGRP